MLLVYILYLRGAKRSSSYNNSILTTSNKMELIKSIYSKQEHFITNALLEIRIIFHLNNIIGLDIEAKQDFTYNYK